LVDAKVVPAVNGRTNPIADNLTLGHGSKGSVWPRLSSFLAYIPIADNEFDLLGFLEINQDITEFRHRFR
jgi:hypothetical protein